MDINHDWSLGLKVSSMTNVHRGFGNPPPTVDMDGDFLPEVVREGGGQSCSVAIPPLMERFHPDALPPSVMRDYYELGEVQNTVLRGECLLISLYVHHLFITQPKNFSRIIKKSNWLTDIMTEKLQTISRGVSLRFGDNLKGRGHWEEIEFIRRSFPQHGGRSINVNKPTIKVRCFEHEEKKL